MARRDAFCETPPQDLGFDHKGAISDGGKEQEEEEEEEDSDSSSSTVRRPRLDEKREQWFEDEGKAKAFMAKKLIEAQNLSSIPVRGKGFCLLEVFGVHILSGRRRKKPTLSISGTITVSSIYGTGEVIFRRTTDSPDVISPEDSLTLTSPTIGISACDVIDIMLDLKGDGCEVKEETDFFSRRWCWLDYDKPLVTTFKGRNCSALVSYAAFKDALLTEVQIKLLNLAVPTGIYGMIEASIMGWEGLPKTTLLRKKLSDHTIVQPEDGRVPLSKSLLSVPIGHPLKIAVRLKDSRTNSLLAVGVASYEPKDFLGEKKKIISGKYGLMEVTFCAWSWYNHPKTACAYRFCYEID